MQYRARVYNINYLMLVQFVFIVIQNPCKYPEKWITNKTIFKYMNDEFLYIECKVEIRT